MVKNINIAKFWKLLILIPAVLLLFACSGVEGNNSAVDETLEDNAAQEVKHRRRMGVKLRYFPHLQRIS